MSQFKINEIVYEVPEFTVAQDEQFMEILASIGLGGVIVTAEIDIAVLVNGLTRGKALRRFLALCLVAVNTKFDEEKLPEMEKVAASVPSSLIQSIVEEFIKKNKPWIEKLAAFLQTLKEKYVDAPEKKKDTTPATTSDLSTNLPMEMPVELSPSGT